MTLTNMSIVSSLWKIRKKIKQVNFLNTSLIRIITKTYENLPVVSKPKTVAVTICYTCLRFYIENVFGFTGNW